MNYLLQHSPLFLFDITDAMSVILYERNRTYWQLCIFQYIEKNTHTYFDANQTKREFDRIGKIDWRLAFRLPI